MGRSSFRWSDFWVVRSALLPFEFSLSAAGEELPAAATRLVSDGVVRRALETASPSLIDAHDDPKRRGAPAHYALVRYVERMRGRATPFAILAGYTVIDRGEQGPLGIQLDSVDAYRHVIRLDVQAVSDIVRSYALAHRENVRWVAKRDVLYFPHAVRIVKRGKDESLSYDDITRTPELERVLEHARTPRSLAALAELLPARYSSKAKAGFLDQLVEFEVLVPEFFPPLMGDDERTALHAVPEARTVLDTAEIVRSSTFSHDLRAERSALTGELRKLWPDMAGEGIIHDLLKPAVSAALDEDAQNELDEVLDLFAQLAAAVSEDPRLAAFRQHFSSRYENREVRLVDALDEDTGWDFPVAEPPIPEAHAPLRRLLATVRDRARNPDALEVALADVDLAALRDDKRSAKGERDRSLPRSGALVCNLAVDPSGRIEVWDPWIAGPPGTNLFGRAAGVDPHLCQATRRWLEECAAGLGEGVDVADVSYFVIGKTAAISQYPVLQPVEITLTSATAARRSIDVNDLLLSVVGGSFHLRDGRTGRRVIIRRTSAVVHARTDTTSLVRFLDAAATAEERSIVWPQPDPYAPFTPRVRWGRHVLASARWSLDKRELDALVTEPHDARLVAVAKLREQRRLPRHVLYEEVADHWLHVDLDCPVSVGAWLDIAKAPVKLRECFPVGRSAVTGPEGHFVHQAVFPFSTARQADEEPLGARRIEPATPSLRDVIPPGGPWLYLEIAGSRQELLPLVVSIADDVLEPLREAGVIEQWFYLPYAQPEPHVRVRVAGRPDALFAEVLPQIRGALEPAFANELVRDLSIRTYERETYRYGGAFGMDLTERVWSRSSARVVDRLRELDGVLDMELEEIVLELVALHTWLLDHSSLGDDAKQRVAARAFQGYARTDQPIELRRRGAALHRALRDRLTTLPPTTEDDALREVLRAIDVATQDGRITRGLPELLADYLHTQTIRLLTVWHPLPDLEPLAYVVLEKVYASAAARKKA